MAKIFPSSLLTFFDYYGYLVIFKNRSVEMDFKKQNMKFKLYCLLVPAILSLAGIARAQGYMNGSFSVQAASGNCSYTASSLTMDPTNFTEPFSPANGTFSTTMPEGTEVDAYSVAISGLSSSSFEAESITNFLIIGGPGPTGSPGTSPLNRFVFDLQSLEEPTPGTFVGYGTLTDTTGDFADTSAQMTLGFSAANNYSINVATVPEPGSLAIALAGLGGFLVLRRKS
jgi:PEP-CTERM motif